MLGPIARFLTRIYEAKLAAAMDTLVELERKWQFEWEHTPARTKYYLKYRTRLEDMIRELRERLGYTTEEGS